MAVNCAAVPADLLEAEMFGIGDGVATGVRGRTGRFQQAAGGTLLLDEVGDMSAALQAKLLRALQEKEIHPVGRPAVGVDVRVGATGERRGNWAGGGFPAKSLAARSRRADVGPTPIG